MNELIRLGFSGVLHGHQHHRTILRFQDALREDSGHTGTSALYIFGAGSVAADDDSPIRQCFMHEFGPDFIQTTSYEMGRKEVYFQKKRSVTTPLWHVGGGSAPHSACDADIRARPLLFHEPTQADSGTDTSNLTYVFMNVRSPEGARAAVKRALEWCYGRKATLWPGEEPDSLETEIFTVTGRWDLVLRVRLSRDVTIGPFLDRLKSQLLNDGQIDALARPGGAQDELAFGVQHVLNVRREFAYGLGMEETQPQPLSPPRPDSAQEQKRLNDSYQRTFIFIEAPGAWDDFERELKSKWELGRIPTTILREVAVARDVPATSRLDRGAVLDLSMRCSQIRLLREVNMAINDAIDEVGKAGHIVQSHTLTCFESHKENWPRAPRTTKTRSSPVGER
jgi:hypothetical protein